MNIILFKATTLYRGLVGGEKISVLVGAISHEYHKSPLRAMIECTLKSGDCSNSQLTVQEHLASALTSLYLLRLIIY